jgi:hypothetical protein
VLHILGLEKNLISFNNMSDVGSTHSISEGFMQDGQRCDGLNERILDWNLIHVARGCRLDWMKKHRCF